MTRLSALLRDARGVTVIEFALIMPVFMMLLMGAFDLAHTMYTESMLQGSIQKAARDSTIEGAAGNEDVIDARVTEAVQAVVAGADPTFHREYFTNFGDIKPEDFTDVDHDGQCNNGEPFEDVNNNGLYDLTPGKGDTLGGARDAVLYTVRVEYPRLFPIAKFSGMSENAVVTVSTVLRNQPYGDQDTTAAAPGTGNCT